MRFLFTTTPDLGGFHPIVPYAQALTAAGHEVLVAAAPSLASAVTGSGFRHAPAGVELGGPTTAHIRAAMPAGLSGREVTRYVRRYVWPGPLAAAMAHDLLAIARDWQPDVLVRNEFELGGWIAAERLGVPHAAIQIVTPTPDLYELFAPALAELRSSSGLAPDPRLTGLHRYLYLAPRPPTYRDPAIPLPSTAHSLRPLPFDQSGDETLPDWVDALPARPTVYVTLGTAVNVRGSDTLMAILDGLGDLPLNVIATVGRNQIPADFGSRPANVHVERYIPQTLLLPRCDAVVCHGGSGTVMGALTCGLPLVIVPFAADQPENADRCRALGIGRALEPTAASPAALREATLTVLEDPRYRAAARRLQDEITALPGADHAVRLLERLARERQPISTEEGPS